MKRIRIGKDLYCKLTVLTNGEAISLEDDTLTLIMVSPDNSKRKVGIKYVEDNVIHFHVSPSMQNTTGVYGFEVWKNIGSGHQSVCDKMRAFELVPLSPMEGGTIDPDLITDSVEMEANFFREFVVIDNLDSYLTDVALSANQGRILNDKIEKEVTKRQTLITFDEDDTYVAKMVDAEGNLLIGFKENGETDVPTGLTDDAYELIEALYKKLRDNTSVLTEAVEDITTLGQYVDKTFETKTDAETAHNELQVNIDNEATARATADTTLQTSIDNETKAREDADTTLQANIDNESTARKDADATLQSNIDALAKDVSDTYETKSDATASHEELQTNIDKKQDKLTAGTGIDITDNVITSTVDTNPFVFVDALPTEGIVEGKIYCIPDPESTEEDNVWDEYTYHDGAWEAMGKYIPKVDLTPYQTKEEAAADKSELEGAIKAEQEAREAKDTELEDKINKLEEDASETYETKTDAETAHKKLQEAIDTEIEDRTALIEEAEDETYVTKMVDVDGNLLLGFKESGEIEVPTGLTDDSYNLIEALYKKLKDAVSSITGTKEELQGDIDDEVKNRTALIEETDDDTYVMKQVDNDGNLLIGVKSNGEVEMPTGIPDETATVIEALAGKVAEMAGYLKEIQ